MELRVGHTIVAKLDVKLISGKKHIGFYELYFQIKADVRQTKEVIRFYDFAAEIIVNGAGI
jgi:hypothetical protein